MQPINPLRGETTLVIAGHTFTLVVTMENLAALSIELGDPPFEQLYRRLLSGALGAQRSGLRAFVQSATTAEGKTLGASQAAQIALRDLSLIDLGAWTAAMLILLEAVTRKPDEPSAANDEGKATAA